VSLGHEDVGRPAIELEPFHRVPARHVRRLGREIAGRHRDGRPHSGKQLLDDGELDVRHDDVALRERVVQDVEATSLDRSGISARGLRGDVDGDGVVVHRDNRSEAEPRGRDGEDPRPAACVEEAAALDPREELDAGARRRVGARPERAPGIDDDRKPIVRRWDPRRPDPDPARLNGSMEVAPAILPSDLDRLRPGVGERRADRRLSRGVGVDGQLSRVCVLALLEAVRKAFEEPRARDLGVGAPYRKRDAAEQNRLPSGARSSTC
jgi:hypothetical protein